MEENGGGFVIDAYMDVSTETVGAITAAVAFFKENSYLLSKEEYIFLMEGGTMEAVIEKRMEE